MSSIEEIRETTIYTQGRRLGVKSALIGSVVFAFAEFVGIYVNTIIQQIDTVDGVENIVFTAVWIFFVIVCGIAFTYLPARFLGGFLARSLENDSKKHKLTKRNAFAKGALAGAITGIMICLPILLIQYSFISQTGHGDFFVFIFRSIEATIIASLAGAWTGVQLEKLLSK